MHDTIKAINAVERAAHDLRRGQPVVVRSHLKDVPDITVFCLETMVYANTQQVNRSEPGVVVLSDVRAQFLGMDTLEGKGITIAYPHLPSSDVCAQLSGVTGVVANDTFHNEAHTVVPAEPLHQAALALAEIAELIPALWVCPFQEGDDADMLSVSVQAIEAYGDDFVGALRPVCDTPLLLAGGQAGPGVKAHITVFRTSPGVEEHYALCVGNVSGEKAPLARIHSSCFTGDLLESLRCDCGPQLHAAIEAMALEGGGVILYLMQEGRGIGLANKMRAYRLQTEGLDTVDANRLLGFADDARDFALAAKMLKALDITQVRLMSNNPRKAEGLGKQGVEVVECVPHHVGQQEHNATYLQTKTTRLQHKK